MPSTERSRDCFAEFAIFWLKYLEPALTYTNLYNKCDKEILEKVRNWCSPSKFSCEIVLEFRQRIALDTQNEPPNSKVRVFGTRKWPKVLVH